MSGMNRETIDQELLNLISEVMPELSDVDLSKDMVAEYAVNSISLIRLIVAAEEKFKVSFTDYELSLDGYTSFSDIAALVERKLEDAE